MLEPRPFADCTNTTTEPPGHLPTTFHTSSGTLNLSTNFLWGKYTNFLFFPTKNIQTSPPLHSRLFMFGANCNRWKIVGRPGLEPRPGPFIHAITLPSSYQATRSSHQRFTLNLPWLQHIKESKSQLVCSTYLRIAYLLKTWVFQSQPEFVIIDMYQILKLSFINKSYLYITHRKTTY